jgi:hypothetical protein
MTPNPMEKPQRDQEPETVEKDMNQSPEPEKTDSERRRIKTPDAVPVRSGTGDDRQADVPDTIKQDME